MCTPAAKRSYLRHAQSLKRANVLLAISESSRREAIEALRISPVRIVTISAGIDQRFEVANPTCEGQATLMERYGLRRPFVLTASAVEPRKNVEGLITAFALLPRDMRLAHQLAIVGSLQKGDDVRLAALATKNGLDSEEIVCLDHVPDDDLRLLYSICSVFVFPSLHEGFGLPILEAMICGAPAIGSNCTSIPEIIDRHDALFDPRQPDEIASRIAAVLSNPGLRQSMKVWGRERAKKFTWQSCARKALDAFEGLHERHKGTNVVTLASGGEYRPLLAFVSPITQEQTEITDYPAKLLPSLARYYEVVCIVDKPEPADRWATAEFPIRNVSWFEENAGRFERILYQLSNSCLCKHMFRLLERHPGAVLLHDFFLGELLGWMADSGYAACSFAKTLYDSHGFSAVERDRLDGREKSIEAFPCNAAVFKMSMGVIAPSGPFAELARLWYGKNAFAAVRQLPDLPSGVRTHNPSRYDHREAMAALYRDIIEEIYATSSQMSEKFLFRAIARIAAPAKPSDADLAKVAAVVVANRESFGLPQILIDVTILADHDTHTGIQRVTRAILMALITDPPAGYRIEPVSAVDGEYRYARRFTSKCLGLSADDLPDDPVEAGRGDIFLGVDWVPEFVPAMRPWFLAQRRRGTRIIFAVYDVLPLLRPELFPKNIPPITLDWINTVVDIADGVICISRTVADEVHKWLNGANPHRFEPLPVGFFHLGADLQASLPTKGLSQNASEILEKLRNRPSFLMVGTVEPRRGHRQALAAMEELWASDADVNLVIIGKKGWKMADLVERIQGHPEHNKRLFWLSGISDELLELVYRGSRALLAPSEGEGFGLPLIEAAQYGLPIIARDIPVFREVAGENAYYFCGEDPQILADALRNWLSLGDTVPLSTGITPLTWHQSSRQLLDVVLKERWYRSWPDSSANPRTARVADCAESDAPAISSEAIFIDH